MELDPAKLSPKIHLPENQDAPVIQSHLATNAGIIPWKMFSKVENSKAKQISALDWLNSLSDFHPVFQCPLLLFCFTLRLLFILLSLYWACMKHVVRQSHSATDPHGKGLDSDGRKKKEKKENLTLRLPEMLVIVLLELLLCHEFNTVVKHSSQETETWDFCTKVCLRMFKC